MRTKKAIGVAALRDYIERTLRAVGCSPATVAVAAEIFLEADMRGVSFQGIDHIHTMIRGIQNGHIDPAGEPVVITEAPAYALIDGHRGPGQPAGVLAADLAIAKARKAGTCCVGIVNSSDIFMVGYYAERIAKAGLVGFVFTGAPPSVHPYGGIERILGTNPFAIAFPTNGPHPVVIDMATSAVSNSFLRQAAYYDEPIPDSSGVDRHGKPARTARDIRQGGAIAPLAGHKGFALSLAVALLAGPLVGAQVGKANMGWRSDDKGAQGVVGHFLLAIDPGCFGDPQIFRATTSAYLNEITTSQMADGAAEIRIPGSRSFERRQRSLRDGVYIDDAIWDNFAALAAGLGVAVPQVTDVA
jgi:LDH2 family malate/lactate/ureidoglycolate dehydrogenase